MEYQLSISGLHYSSLRRHLYPPDGLEAVAVALCGRHETKGQKRLLIHELILIPYDQCSIRERGLVQWSTELLTEQLVKASKKGMAVLKMHSHPTGFSSFSSIDDNSDRELFHSVFGWMEDEEPHASAVMLPDGSIFGRVFLSDLRSIAFSKVNVIGDDLSCWSSKPLAETEAFSLRTAQAFGEGTTSKMRGMSAAIIGCSGTGSPVIEQLARLGIGKILLIDPDKLETKNLNRILNSTADDVRKGAYKVDLLKRAIEDMGLGTDVVAYYKNVYDDIGIINDIASCDVIFGCVDSVDGRHLLNLIATFYLIPYFDLGVKLISDRNGGIDQIMGSVHYVQPGGSSLRTRGVYSEEELRSASLLRTDPKRYAEQRKSGYIVDVNVESPAVISVNMQVASMAVNDFLARIHPFRYDSNSEFAINRFSLTDGYFQHDVDGTPDEYLKKFVGRGNLQPLLNMPELS